MSGKNERESDGKNEYCWNGCYDEKTEWMVVMKPTKPHGYNQGPGAPIRWLVSGPGDANGELIRYSCPKCDSGWWMDDGPRDIQESRSNRKYPLELGEKYGIDVHWGMEDKDDWTEENCIHCDGKGAAKKSRAMINHKNGIDLEVECDHCGGSGKTTVLRPKYCQHDKTGQWIRGELVENDSAEGCSNEAQFKCEAQNWCNGDWVCVEHWVVHAYHDWSCVICSDEYAAHGN